MTDLDEARKLLEKIAEHNQTKLGTTEVTYMHLAVELLLKDYVERGARARQDAERLTEAHLSK
jgi:hypothetical protein